MKKWPAILLIFLSSLCLNSLLFSQPDPDPERFRTSIESFSAWDAKNSIPENYILFIGSSSIRMWKTAEEFPQYKIVNRGFGGAHISDLLFYLYDIAFKYPAPRCIVFYCGDNDIAGNKDPGRVLIDYKKFVARIHNRFSETPIVYLPAKPSLKRWSLWPTMDQLNNAIKSYSDESPLLYYADTATPMLGTLGKPPADIFIQDGLHLSKKGYQLWDKVLGKILEEIFSGEEK